LINITKHDFPARARRSDGPSLIWIIPAHPDAGEAFSGRIRTEEVMLAINPGKVRDLIEIARMFDAKVADSDPDSGSNASDDGMADVLEDLPEDEDATYENLLEFIRGLDDEEQTNLVALAWIGRGTYGVEDWDQALAEARRAHNNRTAEYLTSLPILGDYLEEGLSALETADEDDEVAS
jgi:hypothetical protein